MSGKCRLLAVAAAVALGLTACLPVKVPAWQESAHAPKPGDLVRIETTEGVRHVFRVYKTDDRAFYGTASDNEQYRVPYKVVKTLEVRTRETEWVMLPVAVTPLIGPVLAPVPN